MGRCCAISIWFLLFVGGGSLWAAPERMQVLIGEGAGPEGLVFTGFQPCGEPAFHLSVEFARVKPRSLRFLRTRLHYRPELTGVVLRIEHPGTVPSLEDILRLFTPHPPTVDLRQVTVISREETLRGDFARLLSCGTLVFLPGEWTSAGEDRRGRITLADWLRKTSVGSLPGQGPATPFIHASSLPIDSENL